jgi:uncharacterized protein YjaZ
MSAMWEVPIEELSECTHGGYDGNGKEYSMSWDELIKTQKGVGCYGFTRDKDKIHVWIEKYADPLDVVCLLAHEYGHLLNPHHRDDMKEEVKAEQYARCAGFAFNSMKDLLEK